MILWRLNGESNPKNESKEESNLKSNLKPESEEKSNLKNKQNSDQKIIVAIKSNSKITISELAQITGLSQSGVKKIIRQLCEAGKIRRVGPDKGGHWEVL